MRAGKNEINIDVRGRCTREHEGNVLFGNNLTTVFGRVWTRFDQIRVRVEGFPCSIENQRCMNFV